MMPTKRVSNLSRRLRVISALCVVATFAPSVPAAEPDAAANLRSLDAIRSIGKEGVGFDAAIPAAEKLRGLRAGQVAVLLDGMEGVNPIAENWLRGVVFDVIRSSDRAPLGRLEKYAMDQSRNPIGRGLAMELIRQESPEIATALIDRCLNDTSLPLREMAVEQAIVRAKAVETENPSESKLEYRAALASARHPRQLSRILTALAKLGDEVRTADAFVMITDWKSLAPLNNQKGVGYAIEYAPEKLFASKGLIDDDTEYEGKNGAIRWQSLGSDGDAGVVDLATAYDKEKGAVAYLYTEFSSIKAMPAQARLGCTNANKMWINGKQVMKTEVYHAGAMIDQYIANFPLRKGVNRIFVKICQNEQEESWAQAWEFQFRITDTAGKGLQSAR